MNEERHPVAQASPELFFSVDDFVLPKGDHIALQKRILSLGLSEERARAQLFAERANKKVKALQAEVERLREDAEKYRGLCK
jgi:hypothetical protein